MRIFRLGNRGAPPGKETLISPTKGRHCLESTMSRFSLLVWYGFVSWRENIYGWYSWTNYTKTHHDYVANLDFFSTTQTLRGVLPTLLIYCRLYALSMQYNVVQVKTLKHRQVSFIPNQAFMESYGQNWSGQCKKNRRAHIPKELDRFW